MPTTNFSVAVSADDGSVSGIGNTYAPAASNTSIASINENVTKTFSSPNYTVSDMLMRWDTSSIPDAATILDAKLRFVLSSKTDGADNRNLNVEWYSSANWPIDLTDYAALVGTTAAVVDLAALTAGASNDITLTPAGNVNKTGYTGLRLGLDGGAPTVINQLQIASFDHTTSTEPILVVTWTMGGGASKVASEIASASYFFPYYHSYRRRRYP